MLGPGRYLLGILEICLLAGFAWLGAAGIRRRALSNLDGAPAHLATAVIALAILLWAAELLGTFGLFEPVPYLLLVAGAGLGAWALTRGWCRGGGVSAARRLLRAGREPSSRDVPVPEAARSARTASHPGHRTRGPAVGPSTL